MASGATGLGVVACRAQGGTSDLYVGGGDTLPVFAVQYDNISGGGSVSYLAGDRPSFGSNNVWTGHQTFQGGVSLQVVSKSGAYTAQTSDEIILVDASGGAVTITLPAASNEGQVLLIKKIDNSANAVTVVPGGGDTIEGAANISLASQWDGAILTADGANDWQNWLAAAGGADPNAIHDNVAGEINAIAEKGSPVDADLVIIEDSADSYNKKKAQLGNLPSGAPRDAQYLVLAVNGTLTDERVLTPGDGLDGTDGGAGGAYTLAVDVTDIIDTGAGLTEAANDIQVNLGSGLSFDGGGAVQWDAYSDQFVVMAASGNLPNERVLTGTANQVIVTDGGAGGAVTLSLPQDIHAGASPTFAGMTLNGALALDGDLNFQGPQSITTTTGDLTLNPAGEVVISKTATFLNTGLHILDTDASHDLIIAPGSNLTADRTLTLTTGDANRAVTLNGDVTLDDWFDQSVKQAASPTFAGLTLSGLTASRLLATNGSKALTSTDLASWVAGTTNRITVTDDGDGTITLSAPQDLHTGASPTFGGLSLNGNLVLSGTVDGVDVANFNAAQFLVLAASAYMANERVLTLGDGLDGDDGGAGGSYTIESNVIRRSWMGV